MAHRRMLNDQIDHFAFLQLRSLFSVDKEPNDMLDEPNSNLLAAAMENLNILVVEPDSDDEMMVDDQAQVQEGWISHAHINSNTTSESGAYSLYTSKTVGLSFSGL
ncbi:hypothetical protein AAF712_016091 [Marasmius tenuissimus]|uniref:Uncharacterized protein n=1 Tax=Marasmius tenuissimus TaxID=585030 RepID=A0ABR2Z6K7_9AGAR